MNVVTCATSDVNESTMLEMVAITAGIVWERMLDGKKVKRWEFAELVTTSAEGKVCCANSTKVFSLTSMRTLMSSTTFFLRSMRR
mmetsp:Transcript_9167/g.20442  ORF Transcript_9167/g.20442 Transcript_9167/m.20442 type:complete len:85 (-) Transcript_9167:156-410(-)